MKENQQKVTHRELGWAIRDLVDDQLDSKSITLLYTAHACIDSNFQFHWSQKSLALTTRLSVDSVRRAINLLIRLGYLSRLRCGNNTHHLTNLYRLNHLKIASNSVLKKYRKSTEAPSTQLGGLLAHSHKAPSTVLPLAYCISDREANTAIPLSGVSVALSEKKEQTEEISPPAKDPNLNFKALIAQMKMEREGK